MNCNPLRVYIGYDQRESAASAVAEASLRRYASVPVHVTHLKSERLAEAGLLRRPTDTRGKIYDIHSNAFCASQFAISRFMVPLLAHSGPALFVDADVIFMDDVAKLFALADPRYAIMVVHHNQHDSGTKMDQQIQYNYKRKNQSSVCLWNVQHVANKRLSLQDVNERPGRDLHNFYWLNESEIGYLPDRWNWLVGVEDKPENPAIAHLTLGGPWLSDWSPSPHDELWINEYKSLGVSE